MEDYRLKVFRTVYAAGGFTRAAGILGITQPAVSQNISELERSLGTALFSRAGGRVMPTPQGEIFYRYACRITDAFAAAETVFLTGLPDETRYRIYPSPVARDYLMDDLLRTLSILYPGRTFEVTDTAEGADICIISAPSRQAGCLVFRFDVFPSDHPLSRVVTSLLDDLLG